MDLHTAGCEITELAIVNKALTDKATDCSRYSQLLTHLLKLTMSGATHTQRKQITIRAYVRLVNAWLSFLLDDSKRLMSRP